VQEEELYLIQFGNFLNQIIKLINRYIESNQHPSMSPDAERVNYKVPNFFEKFWELNQVMWRTNAGLVESHAWDSRPQDWPWLRRGINFWYPFSTYQMDLIVGGKIIDKFISLGM
jgi:dolichyl-phosphate-mannose--protein O-mannosyl transferase